MLPDLILSDKLLTDVNNTIIEYYFILSDHLSQDAAFVGNKAAVIFNCIFFIYIYFEFLFLLLYF